MTSTNDEREALRDFADRMQEAAANCCIDPDAGPDAQTSISFTGEEGAKLAHALHCMLASLPAPTPAAGFPDIGPDPFKGPREGYTLANAEARLRDAFTVQQKGVPDQTALVWRCDLLKLFHELPRLRSIEDAWRVAPYAAPQPPAPGGDAVERIIITRADIALARKLVAQFQDDDFDCERISHELAKHRTAALANHSPDAGDVGEVEAIVAWLRSEADSYAGGALIKGALRGAAERIENGDHRAALRPVPRGEG